MKHAPETREKIDRCILDANLGRLTEAETIELIQHRVGITVTRSNIAKRRYFLRKDTDKMWEICRKNNFAYKRLHSELMQEADNVRGKLNKQIIELDNGDRKNIFFLQKCYNSLLDWNKRKQELTSEMRAIDSIGHSYSYEMDNQIPELESETNGQIPTQKGRVF